jgi:hypothetical protein
MEKALLKEELAEARARLDYAVRKGCWELANISGLEIAQISRQLALIEYREFSEQAIQEAA